MSGLCLTSVLLFNDLVMELGFASQPSYAELKAPLGRRWWTHSCAGAARDSAAPDGRVLESDSSVSRGSSKYLFNVFDSMFDPSFCSMFDPSCFFFSEGFNATLPLRFAPVCIQFSSLCICGSMGKVLSIPQPAGSGGLERLLSTEHLQRLCAECAHRGVFEAACLEAGKCLDLWIITQKAFGLFCGFHGR